jgi:APA family basic amino acid/polyamine antiporter
VSTKPLELVRGLGPWAAAAIVVGTMIGTGIFIVPADIARNAGTIPLVFGVWIVGGALSLFGALCFAELGAALPEAGGEYAYLNRGYGLKWGFLFGWMNSLIGGPTAVAAISAGLLRFCRFLVPAAGAPIFAWHAGLPFHMKPYEFAFTWAQPLAVVVIILVTFVNYLGVRLGGQVQVVLTIIKVAAVVAVIGVGFAMGHSAHGAVQSLPASAVPVATIGGLFAALASALWAYDGWNNLGMVGSEIANPEKNIPKALVGGVVLVGLLYLGITAACLYALAFGSVATSSHVASDLVAKVAGDRAATWLTLAMALCALGALNSSILTNSRVTFAMSRDNLFFRVAAGVHPQYRTPANALIFQGILASLLALTGTFEELYNLYVFANWIFYGLTAAALLSLRHKERDLPRPYRVWGYPVVPLLFIASAIAITSNLLLANPVHCTIGLALILFGLVFYHHWRRQAASN